MKWSIFLLLRINILPLKTCIVHVRQKQNVVEKCQFWKTSKIKVEGYFQKQKQSKQKPNKQNPKANLNKKTKTKQTHKQKIIETKQTEPQQTASPKIS